jgi:vitamin-K-epoxide reductase (warfarin-sensitive)
LRYLIALLAVAGMVVSYLALQVHRSDDTAPCSINEHWDCGIVNHSRYAEIRGVPVAAIGIAGYLVLAAVALLRRKSLLLILSVLALVFTLRLSYIEYHNLQVWCLYCVISQGVIALIALLAVLQMFFGRRSLVAG